MPHRPSGIYSITSSSTQKGQGIATCELSLLQICNSGSAASMFFQEQ